MLAFLGVLLLAGPIASQDRPALRFDPNQIEFATPWAQSSLCLGDMHDPSCLAQTVVICSILLNRTECGKHLSGGYDNPLNYDRIEYRILRAGYVAFERLEAMQEHLLGQFDSARHPMAIRRAVIAQYLIRRNICPAAEANCEGFLATDVLVILELTRRGWGLVNSQLFGRADWYAD